LGIEDAMGRIHDGVFTVRGRNASTLFA
jgi:hypothetical protein